MDISNQAKELRAYLSKASILDLAVAFVMALAFTSLIASFIRDIVSPFLGVFFGDNFSSLSFTINDSVIMYGSFLTSLISFAVIAAIVYHFVVKPAKRRA